MTVAHDPQFTTVEALEKTVLMREHRGHLTSMKKELGSGTTFLSLRVRAWASADGWRRSTARVWDVSMALCKSSGERA